LSLKEFEEPLLVSDASAALPRHTPKLKELAIPLKVRALIRALKCS